MVLILLEELLRAAVLKVAEVIVVVRRQQLSRNFGLFPYLGSKKRGQSPSSPSPSSAAAPSANCG